MNKKALESSKISARINYWIDLIFRYKQQGKEVLYAMKVDVNKLDEKEREDK